MVRLCLLFSIVLIVVLINAKDAESKKKVTRQLDYYLTNWLINANQLIN